MKYSAYFRDEVKNEAGFTLLEILLVIVISSLLTVVFIQLILNLYQSSSYFNLHNAWQLDAFLVVDFISEQIKNAKKVDLVSTEQLDLFCYYDQEYQWLRFNVYQSSGQSALGRAIGSNNLNDKDFGRNLALLDKISELSFQTTENGLIQVTLSMEEGQENITVSRLIKIN